MLAIKINAGNDRNGNPRRDWIIADDDGDLINFVDEGYQGSTALKTSFYSNVTPTQEAIEVTPGTYRKLLRAMK